MITKTGPAEAGDQYVNEGLEHVAAILDHLEYLEAQLQAETSWYACLKVASAQVLASTVFVAALVGAVSAIRHLPLY